MGMPWFGLENHEKFTKSIQNLQFADFWIVFNFDRNHKISYTNAYRAFFHSLNVVEEA